MLAAMRPSIVTSIALLFFGACGKSSAPDKGVAGSASASAAAPAPAPSPGPASDIDVAGFCARTMAGKNPAQCYGNDAAAQQVKESMCEEVLGGAISQGHATVDPAKLAACEHAVVAAIATLDNQRGLGDLADRFAECRDVAVGKLAAGAECLGTMECAPGLTCMQMKCATRGAEGAKCQPLIELTLSAAKDTCEPGLYCDLAEGTCRKSIAAGGACKISGDCAAPLRCRDDKCVAATRSKHDGPCDDDHDCPTGDVCSLGGHCEAPRADGAECLTNGQCAHRCVDDHCAPCPT
jgi:hypothetical protein